MRLQIVPNLSEEAVDELEAIYNELEKNDGEWTEELEARFDSIYEKVEHKFTETSLLATMQNIAKGRYRISQDELEELKTIGQILEKNDGEWTEELEARFDSLHDDLKDSFTEDELTALMISNN
ncbi:hypothetical protein [Mariprofundus ferrooxydans]|uniref:hypothetical protein n=1 Tax=Mariprofundus ferrooxydans TaxID=314344 RepID=UPI0003826EEE|nr:hypothetical protein [Mariprofundus ferrooxydans]